MDATRLLAIPLFAGLSSAELESLASVAGELEVDQGEAVATEGDFGHAFFAVEEGEAEVLQGDEAIAKLGRGDVFGEIALLSSGRRTASVVAVTPMRLISLFKTDVWRLEREAPEVAEALRETVRERLARSTRGTSS